MKHENEAVVRFPSLSCNEAFARSVTAAFAAQMDPTLDELGDVRTAVSEAVTNAIVHAYPDRIGTVLLRLRRLPGNVLEITVKDAGRGIADVAQARQPMFTTGGADRSGMGLTIMESFMNSLSLRSQPGRGTTVRMRKKLIGRGETACKP
jgi:stage II sporulation protein AB (anti-sigma F factor)